MTLTVYEQANAIAENTDQFVFINESLYNDFRNVLLLAALAFDDDDSMDSGGDIDAALAMAARNWPFVATQLEIGLAHCGLGPSIRAQWETAIKGVCRIAGLEFPCRRDGIDQFIPF